MALGLGAILSAAPESDRAERASSRVDVAGMDPSVRPGDDFYAYSNGGWMKTTEIPADRAVYASFTLVEEKVEGWNRDLIQEAAASGAASGSPAGMVGAYYTAWMDEAAIEKRGLTPIQEELDAIRAISDRAALARYLGSGLRADVDALNNTNFYTDRPFGMWVAPGFRDPGRYVAYLMQGGLGLPNRDDYTNTDQKSAELQAKYREHIAKVLELAKVPDAAAKAARIYDLERKIADVHVSRTDSVDVHKADNPWPLAEFGKRAPGLDWAAYFDAAGLSSQPMIMVWHPSATVGIAKLAGGEPLDLWKDYLTFRAIDRASGLLPKAFAEERFRFYGTVLSGAPKQRDRWKRAVNATSGDPRRRRRPPLRREALLAVGQGAGAGDGQEHRRGVRTPHRPARLDVARDEGEGEGEARDALRRHRLSREVARLHGPAHREGRPARQRAARGAVRLPVRAGASSASRSTRPSGA